MGSKFPVKLVALGFVALLVWWLLAIRVSDDSGTTGTPSSDAPDQQDATPGLVSSIQPITSAGAARQKSDSVVGRFTAAPLDQAGNQDLKQRFAKANKLAESGRTERAVQELNGLIADYPSTPELYANLGSLYASIGQLEQARQTFKSGIEANRKAGVLFEGLQKVHGALAANAYKKALDATAPNEKPDEVKLPMVESLETVFDQEIALAELKAELGNQQSAASSTQAQLASLAALQAELDDSQDKAATISSEYQSEIKKLQDQLATQSEALLASQTAEREAQARVVRAEEAAAAQIAEALEKAETEKLAELADKDAVIARQTQEAKRLKKQAESTPVATTVVASGDQPSRDLQAIERVRSWAKAWAAQDVEAYINHYASAYTPGSTISREQWLEQRRVRLTNKAFIEVEVDEFSVKNLGERFSVTFTQHYRSNTVDDTIRKRLIFKKQGDSWSNATIVSERRVAS